MNFRNVLKRVSAFMLALVIAFTAMPGVYKADTVDGQQTSTQQSETLEKKDSSQTDMEQKDGEKAEDEESSEGDIIKEGEGLDKLGIQYTPAPIDDLPDVLATTSTLTVNVDESKAKVFLVNANDSPIDPTSEDTTDGIVVFSIEDTETYSLTITSINSDEIDKVTIDANGTDATGTIAGDKFSYTEEIVTPNTDVVRNVSFIAQAPTTFEYIIMTNQDKVNVVVSGVTSGEVIPEITDNDVSDEFKYSLSSSDTYTVTVTPKDGQKLDKVNDVDVVDPISHVVENITAAGTLNVTVCSDTLHTLTTNIPISGSAAVVVTDKETGNPVVAEDGNNYGYKLITKGTYTISITIGEGQSVTSATLGGNAITFTQGENNVYTYECEVVTSDLLLDAVFAQTYKLAIAANDLSLGKIYIADQEYTNPELIVEEGDTVSFKFTPNNGYYLSKLAVDTVETTNVVYVDGSYTFTTDAINANTQLELAFSQIPTVDVEGNPLESADFNWGFSQINDSTLVSEGNDKVTSILTNGASLTLSKESHKVLANGEGAFEDIVSFDADKTINTVTVFTTSGITSLQDSMKTYRFAKPVEIIVDETVPTLAFENNNPLWIGEKAGVNATAFKVSAAATQTDIAQVVYLTEAKDVASDYAYILANGTPLTKGADGYYLINCQYGNDITATTTYYIYAVNKSGVMNRIDRVVNVDATVPVITSVKAEDVTGFLWGLFTKEDIFKITVTASDEGIGLKEIALSVSDGTTDASYRATPVDGKVTFEIRVTEGKTYTLSLNAIDQLENVSDPITAVSAVNKNGGEDPFTSFKVDKASPSLELVPEETSETKRIYNKPNTSTYYVGSQDFSINYRATDEVSGVEKYEVYVNDAETPVVKVESTALTQQIQDTFNISQAPTAADGVYEISVVVTDAAGNTKTESLMVCIDNTAPEIERITISGNKRDESDGALYRVFGTEITVKVEFSDEGISGYETSGSGVDGVEFYFVKENGEEVEPENDYIRVGADGTATIRLDTNFVGTMCLRPMDNMLQDGINWTTTDTFIVETADKHNDTSSVVNITEGTSLKTADDVELYLKDTSIDVVVTDEISGIDKIEYVLEIPNGTEITKTTKTIEVEAVDTLSDSTWTIEESKVNVVNKVKGNVAISGNANNITLSVTMTDNAGNVTEDVKQIISIDKTKPEVEVSFNNTVDSGFYNTARIATITVYERNFDAKKVSVAITNTDGTIPSVSSWKTTTNVNNPDKTAHTATVTFSADGDYNMTVSAKDMGNLNSNVEKVNQFTIDATAPIISINYNTNESLNEKYYGAQRTATITINEHNFDASKVVINGVATDNGVPSAFPSVTGWGSAGDSHSTTLVFGQDGYYTFDVTVTDKSGNTASQTTADFYVDMIIPQITFSNIEENSANSGEVAPVITITDTNYNQNGVTIDLVGANHGAVATNGVFSATANGQVFSFANFAEEQEFDDIYTLHAAATDMAGNMFEDEISFSVNRFGSVYVLGDEIAEIVGKYVTEPVDVVITETNVNQLDFRSIKVVLTVNGTPRTLVLNEDYSISEVGGAGSWSQYTYRIGKELFAGDGTYSVTIYSVDAAGNVNENIQEIKEAEITFGIDTVDPLVSPLNFEEGFTAEAESYEATVAITDNLLIQDIRILLNGEAVEYTNVGDEYKFTINESNNEQRVSITVADAAGNTTTLEIGDIWVTTNQFAKFINGGGVVAVAGGTVAVAGVGGGIIFFRRRGSVIKVKRK